MPEALDGSVTGHVSVGIIDCFEMVNVQHDEAQPAVFAVGARNFNGQLFFDLGVFEQAGAAVFFYPREWRRVAIGC